MVLDAFFAVAEAVGALAGAGGAATGCCRQPGVTAPIIGARNLEQLNDNMAAAEDWSLSDEQMKQLDDASAPELVYPYDFVKRALR